MAGKEKKEAPSAAEETPAAAAPKRKLPMSYIMVGLAVVLLEGGTVGVMMMASGGPKRVLAEVPATQPKDVVDKDTEMPIIDAKLPNSSGGHLYMYDIQIVAKVNEKNKARLSEVLTEHAAEVRDKIRTIIASTEKRTLDEPGLETLRRQISYQLEQDVGPDVIKELLIPKCTPFRAEF
jgi:flagellar basal body-associated protein FliL